MTESAIPERVRQGGRSYADRRATVDLTETLHLLPVAQSTAPVAAHDLSAACWCEPEWCTYTPKDAAAGEHYHGWYHHEAN